MPSATPITPVENPAKATFYGRYLLLIAGLGGLLYGIDVGIIAGALPYLEETSGYTPAQLSSVVAAVLAGSVLSSLVAGLLSDLFGRKKIMLLSALLFVASIPIICFSGSIGMLIAGRLLQGISGGLIGVVIPLYLAECLSAKTRGKGTGMFQFLLTVGLVAAALIGLCYANHVKAVEDTPGVTAGAVLAVKDSAWRGIFWASIIPGIAFFAGAFFVSESPRWLFRRGKKDAALRALIKSNGEKGGRDTLAEMEEAEAQAKTASPSSAQKIRDSLLSRKYVLPFVIAVIILACNQATGINSVLAYSVKIFQQAGLTGTFGNYGDVLLKVVNCVMTVVAVVLVDRRGRKFLLKMGTGGIIIGLIGAALLFRGIEANRTDVTQPVIAGKIFQLDAGEYTADLQDARVLKALGLAADSPEQQFIVTYRFGKDGGTELINTGKKSRMEIKAPAGDGKTPAPALEILKAEVGPVPGRATGWLVAVCFIVFIAAFASGPGVCVWLALSELMPTRIRSNGMSIALFINQFVSTTIAAIFLPVVGAVGYSTMFLAWAGFTVIYFCTAAFVMPETKGRTLEEIEEHFEGKKKLS